jgi:hypothetical protein
MPGNRMYCYAVSFSAAPSDSICARWPFRWPKPSGSSALRERPELRLFVLAPLHRLPVDGQRQLGIGIAHFVHDRAGALAEAWAARPPLPAADGSFGEVFRQLLNTCRRMIEQRTAAHRQGGPVRGGMSLCQGSCAWVLHPCCWLPRL